MDHLYGEGAKIILILRALRYSRWLTRAIPRYLVALAKVQFGIPLAMDTPDRYVLEQVILPHLAARTDVKRILFVGCAPYTAHYHQYFIRQEFWTIDPDRWRRVFGASLHVVDFLEHLDRHFPPSYFDLIICNGIIGFGLNRKEDGEVAILRCFECLREGGELVLGWADVPERRPFRPDELASLENFARKVFEPLASWRKLIDDSHLRHTFDFYVKPSNKAGASRDGERDGNRNLASRGKHDR